MSILRHIGESIPERDHRIRREKHAVGVAVDLERRNLSVIKGRIALTKRQRLVREMDAEASIARICTLSAMHNRLTLDEREMLSLRERISAA